MKPSDFVSTSEQKNEAAQSVLQAEMTDAVNSGIVGRADKSAKALKGDLYSTAKKSTKGGAASAALSSAGKGKMSAGKAGADGKAGACAAALVSAATHKLLEGSELEGVDDAYHTVKGASRAARAVGRKLSGKGSLDVKSSLKSAGKAAGRGAVSSTLKDTELEGADNLYDVAMTGYHAVQGAKKRLSGKDALSSDNSLGKLSEKKSAKKAMSTVESKRRTQAAGYFKKNVYSTAEKVKSPKNAAKGIGVAVRGTGSAGGGILAALSPSASVFGIIIIVLLLFMLLIGGLGADETQKKTVGTLEGVPAEIATALKGYGFTNESVAAVLGNMAVENPGFDPNLDGDPGDGNMSLGIMQFTGSNRTNFLRWCAETGKVWSTVSAQIEWVFSGEPGTTSFADGWQHTAPGGKVDPYFYDMEPAYESRFSADYYRDPQLFKESTDVNLATYSFMACYERCGNNGQSHLDKRLQEANKFFAQLVNTGFGGNGNIVDVAASQIGNVGGQPYWSWYGFPSRVEWCACFVSWCANQCGYIESGVIPKFASVTNGIQWFRDHDQFHPRGVNPPPGSIIFFDWEANGSPDHVGIVESCDGTTVHTIEGNTSDSVARRSYGMNSAKIYGYGMPRY